MKYSKVSIEGNFAMVTFYGTENEIKDYICSLNDYFNDGEDGRIFVRYKFYMPKKIESKYLVDIEIKVLEELKSF